MAFDFKNASQGELLAECKRICAEMGDDGFFTKKEIKHLPEVLNDGEPVLGLASGMMDNKTWLIVLTDQRILLLDKGMLYGLRQTEFRLGHVSSVSYETGLMMGKIDIHVSSVKHQISQVPKKAVANFAERIRAQLQAPRPEAPASDSDDDIVSKLERLAALHDRGVLDDQEFADQKAKILG
ncbi:PH domain-containing protein [Chromohalobacter israelensis]|uniref:PH domain-containing protein n=1 Tax=Chromohalobacter israelensis TaxID=141390 RepID=UPI00054D22B9|nr:PH domain-containing protein [Chromohalobacter israelensis]MDF9433006.1 PH domain-containing protein [Chromohalobacter israelensis]